MRVNPMLPHQITEMPISTLKKKRVRKDTKIGSNVGPQTSSKEDSGPTVGITTDKEGSCTV